MSGRGGLGTKRTVDRGSGARSRTRAKHRSGSGSRGGPGLHSPKRGGRMPWNARLSTGLSRRVQVAPVTARSSRCRYQREGTEHWPHRRPAGRESHPICRVTIPVSVRASSCRDTAPVTVTRPGWNARNPPICARLHAPAVPRRSPRRCWRASARRLPFSARRGRRSTSRRS
jgi:hypothetical protein